MIDKRRIRELARSGAERAIVELAQEFHGIIRSARETMANERVQRARDNAASGTGAPTRRRRRRRKKANGAATNDK